MHGEDVTDLLIHPSYLRAASTAEQFNITFASQTLGNQYASTGALFGTQTTITVPCDAASHTCTIPVYAPSVAIVFLSQQALAASGPAIGSADAKKVFLTTAWKSGAVGTQTVNPAALATSNGRGGMGTQSGSTSDGQKSGADRNSNAAGMALGLIGLVAVGLTW